MFHCKVCTSFPTLLRESRTHWQTVVWNKLQSSRLTQLFLHTGKPDPSLSQTWRDPVTARRPGKVNVGPGWCYSSGGYGEKRQHESKGHDLLLSVHLLLIKEVFERQASCWIKTGKGTEVSTTITYYLILFIMHYTMLKFCLRCWTAPLKCWHVHLSWKEFFTSPFWFGFPLILLVLLNLWCSLICVLSMQDHCACQRSHVQLW